MRGEKDGYHCWNLARWQLQDETVASRRCSDRGVVKSDNNSEDNNGKGGGSSVMRSIGSSKQRLRRRQRHREKWRGGTEVAGSNGRKGSICVWGGCCYREGRKGAVKAAAGRGGRKRAAAVVDGWQWRVAAVGCSCGQTA
ncbi:hypothetical protein GW17_00045647, partial [Ensete ventricosum]